MSTIEKMIPQMEPWFDEKEQHALSDYMGQGGWVTEFRKTQEFEKAIADYTGAKHCIATNNGTISLSLALLAVGVEAGDEVIVPDYTMIATPNSAKLLGANPVFVDVDRQTLCIDVDQVEAAITPKTKAIMHVSFNGRSNDIEKLVAIGNKHGVPVIEDSAQSLGSTHNDQHLGTFGLIGSFSFSAPKIISTGQGGVLVTNDDEVAAKIRKIKDFGRYGGGNDFHDEIGFNFKYTDIQAVIGLEQMKKLDWRVKRKKEMYQIYQDELSQCSAVEMLETNLDATAPWFMDIFVDDPIALRDHLKTQNVGTRTVYPPIHSQKCYQLNQDFPVTQHIASRGLWIPSASQLTNEEIKYVCDKITAFYKG